MNVLFSVVLLKTLNISVTAVCNLLAFRPPIVLTLGENCGVVYDKFRHFILLRVGVRLREHGDL